MEEQIKGEGKNGHVIGRRKEEQKKDKQDVTKGRK